jgi:hypothetical protein
MALSSFHCHLFCRLFAVFFISRILNQPYLKSAVFKTDCLPSKISTAVVLHGRFLQFSEGLSQDVLSGPAWARVLLVPSLGVVCFREGSAVGGFEGVGGWGGGSGRFQVGQFFRFRGRYLLVPPLTRASQVATGLLTLWVCRPRKCLIVDSGVTA